MGRFADAQLIIFGSIPNRNKRVVDLYEYFRRSFLTEYSDGLPTLSFTNIPVEIRGGRGGDHQSVVRIEVIDDKIGHKDRIELISKTIESAIANKFIDVAQYNLRALHIIFARSQIFLDGWQPFIGLAAADALPNAPRESLERLRAKSSEPYGDRHKWTYRNARSFVSSLA